MSKLDELIKKLGELFELDKADLDFGIHRIIKKKHEQIKDYLNNKLPNKVKKELEGIKLSSNMAKIEELYNKLKEEHGKKAFDAENKLIDEDAINTAEGQEYIKLIKSSGEISVDKIENDVFSHLLEFFSRYYEDGDFLSLRRSSTKAKYAVPYNGEEVVLHWANKDQYYIKSTEDFKEYVFTVDKDGKTQKVKFNVSKMDAIQNNNKAVRKFILDEDKQAEWSADGITIHFYFKEFKNDTEGKKAQESLVTYILEKLPNDWKATLSIEDTGYTGKGVRSVIEKHVANFTKKNTTDYFIHKDLREFLNQELDFYIKNEVMYLDDIDNRSVDYTNAEIRKIKAIRSVAKDLISFLSQLEDFQKKMWLKKKFVYDTQYCITIDKIIEFAPELLNEVVRNLHQWAEWEELGFLTACVHSNVPVREFLYDENCEKAGVDSKEISVQFSGDEYKYLIEFNDNLNCLNNIDAVIDVTRLKITSKGYDSFSWEISTLLKENCFLVVDTKHFGNDFKYRLLSKIDDIDSKLDGLLIHSENFQALNLLQERYKESVKCVYIDPPYNTQEDSFIYKDGYKYSSWASMIYDRLAISKNVHMKDGTSYISINEDELFDLSKICDIVFGKENYLSNFTIKVRHDERILKGDKDFHEVFENLLGYRVSALHKPSKKLIDNTSLEEYVWDVNVDETKKETLTLNGKNVDYFPPGAYQLIEGEASDKLLKRINIRGTLREGNSSGRFYVAYLETLINRYENHLFRVPNMGGDGIGYRFFWLPVINKRKNGDYFQGVPLDKKDIKEIPYSNLWDFEQDFNRCAQEGGIVFRNGKKPIKFLNEIFLVSGVNKDKKSLVLDYFAGSGTTGHAVINLNREDGGNRKYILVEMGEYFHTVLLPRIKKVVYSEKWKDGKPVDRNGVSQFFKYFRLESYEDALNNLELLEKSPELHRLLQNADNKEELQEQYLLNYMLNIETKGSLLNLDKFINPFEHTIKIYDRTTGEAVPTKIDLPETFNYLLGLEVQEIQKFDHILLIEGKNRAGETIKIIWRDLNSVNNEQLKEFLRKHNISPTETEFRAIYINGDTTLEDPYNKVRLIEETFHKLMFDVQEA